YWRASRILGEYLAAVPDPEPASILLAAQANAGWGDWAGVERLLSGRGWLDTVAGGFGWNLLGRSRLALGRWAEGDIALSRYLEIATRAGARRPAAGWASRPGGGAGRRSTRAPGAWSCPPGPASGSVSSPRGRGRGPAAPRPSGRGSRRPPRTSRESGRGAC